jgi:hypothetical protein
MASNRFTKSEWNKIHELMKTSSKDFGLPERHSKSVVIGTFNIRELGKIRNRSSQAWDFLIEISKSFDLLAIQEVADSLEGINHIKKGLGEDYGMAVSDVTGVFPGDLGNPERLAFLFNWTRIQRTELASDITYDRSKVIQTLFENRWKFNEAWENQIKKLGAWQEKVQQAKSGGKTKPSKPVIELPMFLTFIRQPHCVSFRIPGKNGADPIEFLTVNAHLLYGENEEERLYEFNALIDWLTLRAKQDPNTYHPNLLLMGDCNLEFEDINIKRKDIDERLKELNETTLKSKKAAKVNFPFLTKHPTHGEIKTNARQDQTYDQIAIFAHDSRLPDYKANAIAGKSGDDGYDYGVFSFIDIVSKAIYGKKFKQLNDSNKENIIYNKVKKEISDHMPGWIRLPIPSA